MKRKYYMRGLGIGILVTALVCAFTMPKDSPAMTDDEIIARAGQLGYIKKEETVTAEDINKIKENGKVTEQPKVSQEASPETTPEPTSEPTVEVPLPPEMPSPSFEVPQITKTPEATQVPVEIVTPEPVVTNLPAADSYTVVVERGMTARRVAEQLEDLGAVSSADAFVKYLQERKLTDFINIGSFTIPSGASYEDIGRILTK